MKTKSLILILFAVLIISCKNTKTNNEILSINADSLIANIDQYIDKSVDVEGTIVHICGVDGRKMKLKTESGAIIKIVPLDSSSRFDTSYYKKRISVLGKVMESKVDKTYIDEKEREKTLLCHIDNTPCKDSAWVNRQIKKGIADSLSNKDIEKLRDKMRVTQKDYVSVVTIIAKRCDIVEKQ